jgi:hypothetical protein
MKSNRNKTKIRKNVSNTKKTRKTRKTRRIKKMKGGQSGFDEDISKEIENKASIESGKDTTQSVFNLIDEEILESVITCEDDKGEDSAPVAFLNESVREYQDKSYTINNFLRDNVAFYAKDGERRLLDMLFEGKPSDSKKNTALSIQVETKKKEEVSKLIKEYLPEEIKNKIKKISAIDYLFKHENVPKFKEQTILYRGTDRLYNTEDSFIDPAFVSTTKTLETLFTVPDKFIDKTSNCCIHVFLVDTEVPYIDLEKERCMWSYQKEVLLPRGLLFEKIKTGKYTISNEIYKAYLYKVSLPTTATVVYNADDEKAINEIVDNVITNIKWE